MNKKSWFPLWIAMAIGLVVFIYGLANNAPERYSGRASSNAEQGTTTSTTQPSSGSFIITSTNEWKGVSCYDRNKRIVGMMTTRDVWRQVRINQDDNTILTLYPSNWSTNHVELPEFHTIEWRLDPSKPAPRAEIRWMITDRR